MSTTYSVADAATGLFVGRAYTGELPWVQSQLAPGQIIIEGDHDPRRWRVRLVVDDFGEQQPTVHPYQPPAPPFDEWRTWRWDGPTERWVSVPTEAALARDARAERDRRMAAADWVTLRAMRTGQPIPAAWAAYLQALADVPAQPGFPTSITWPDPP